MGLSPTLAVSGLDRPVLPWQPDSSLIDSQERTLPCLDPHSFRKPLMQALSSLRDPGVQTPPVSSSLRPSSGEESGLSARPP